MANLTAIPNTFPTISDGFGPFSDGFGLFSDGFGRFWTVSDGFGPFSDGFGPFSDGFGRFRTVFGSFRIVFRRVPAVLDDSNPNLKNFKFQLATAGARPCRSVRPCRPPQPWPIEIWNFTKNWKKTKRKRPKKERTKTKKLVKYLIGKVFGITIIRKPLTDTKAGVVSCT